MNWIEIDDGVDLALLHRRDRGRKARVTDADNRYFIGLDAIACDQRIGEEVGRGARALTPIFMPLRSPNDLTCAALSLRTASTMPGEAAKFDHRGDVLTLGLHTDGVFVGAGDHIGGTADQ